MRTLTKKGWREVLVRVQKELGEEYPDKPLRWRFEMSHKIMRKHFGTEPPGLVSAAIGVLFKTKVKGESMDWKWSKASWKGLRAALAGAAAIGAVAVGEALLAAADTEAELLQLGAPVLLIPVLLGVGAVGRNYLKQRKKAKEVEFVTPPGPDPNV